MSCIKMRISTRLQRLLTAGSAELKYDAWACRVLGEPMVIATLVKAYVPEFSKCPLEKIVGLIVGTIDLSVHGEPDDDSSDVFHETTSDSEDSLPNVYLASSTDTDKSATEGTVAFDVKVHIRLPDQAQLLQVIINIEAQKHSRPWRRLLKRQQYSLARMVSSQHEHEFRAPEYEKLMPVYSIWVMLEPSKTMQNRVLRMCYTEDPVDVRERVLQAAEDSIRETFAAVDGECKPGVLQKQLERAVLKSIRDVYDPPLKQAAGSRKRQKKDRQAAAERRFRRKYQVQSLTNGVMIWLGPPSKASDKGSRFLDILFDRDMNADKKGDRLQQEFKIPKTTMIEREIGEMGALSAAIKLEGEKIGKKKGEKKGRKKGEKIGKQIARKEDAIRAAGLLFEVGCKTDQVVSMIRKRWPELTEAEIQDAADNAREL